jgi:ubiquitin carboxyl-terminal hydrolase L3
MNSNFEWVPLESDPSIFNTYFNKLGLNEKSRFEELFTLDEEYLQFIEDPVYAVILNSEKTENYSKNDFIFVDKEAVKFYMKQDDKLTNACGVVAGLHAIGSGIDVENYTEEESILNKFFLSSKEMSDTDRCDLLASSDEIKQNHSEVGVQGSTEVTNKVKHHYTTFVLGDKNDIYELDGRQESPILIKDNSSRETFLIDVVTEIKRRLDSKIIKEQLSVLYLTIKN